MKNTLKKLTVIFVLAALAALTLTGCGAKAVSTESFIQISFSGMDGEGIANPSFDYWDFEKEVMSGWKEKDQTMEKMAALTQLGGTISCEADKTENLRNGDKVKVTVSYDKDLAKKLGVSFKDLSSTFTVEGLKEPIYVDPFDTAVFGTEAGVNVKLYGIAPFGDLVIEKNCAENQPQSKVIYEAVHGFNLKNGDTVTITASPSDRALQEGYVLTRTETTYQVEGLDSYILDLSQFLPEDVDKLRSNLEEYFFQKVLPGGFEFYPKGAEHQFGHGIVTARPNNSTVTNFGFDRNGWTIPQESKHGQSFIMVPFHMDMERREVKRLRMATGTVNYEEPITLNCHLHGMYSISGLILDATGHVKAGSFNIDVLECFEDEADVQTYVLDKYADRNIVAGTFVK